MYHRLLCTAFIFAGLVALPGCHRDQPTDPTADANEEVTMDTNEDVNEDVSETNAPPADENPGIPGEPWQGIPTAWTVQNQGQDIYARSVGGGDPILIVINGGPGQSHHYCESTDVLSTTELRVVTFDQRGTGQSPHPADADYTMSAYVDDIEALRQDLGAESIHLLGHSFGGSYAIAYTAAHPDRVASLQLFASSPVWTAHNDATEFERRIAISEANGTFPTGYDDFRNTTDCASYFQTIWPVYLYDPDFPMTEGLLATTCDIETFVGTSNSNPRGWDFRDGVRDYAGPVAVYYGEADPFKLETQSILRYFESTEAQEVEIPRCGHYWEECAEDFLARAARFLGEAL